MDSRGSFSERILNWYRTNKRDLPWRATTNPYPIWLSEIILQQTRVEQGLPYFERFLESFPTLQDLAGADIQEVLRMWQGLGYYSRARNLHRCANKVITEYGGQFPSEFDELLTLPGVGHYTAAAIASLAFNQPVGVVDGNVFRVLSRVFEIGTDIGSSKGVTEFRKIANELVSTQYPGAYNQGIMDIGATICTPSNPKCDICPLSEDCAARQHKSWNNYPVKLNRTRVKTVIFSYFVIQQGEKLWMKKRDSGIWNSLYDFYLIENAINRPADKLSNILGIQAEIGPPVQMRHLLSHREILARFYHVQLREGGLSTSNIPGGKFFTATEIENLPKPRLIESYLQDSVFSDSFNKNI